MKSNNAKTNEEYDGWMSEVRNVLRSINMSLEDWQGIWPFDFSRASTRTERVPATLA